MKPDNKPDDDLPSGNRPDGSLSDGNLSDEEFVSSLIHAAGGDMPAPDPEFLAQLRDRSTQAFLEATDPRTGSRQTSDFQGSGTRQTSEPRAGDAEFLRIQLRRRRTSIALKLASAGVAAVVAIGVLWTVFAPHNSALAFGDALKQTAAAESLHLKIARDGQTGEIWYAGPDRFRWNRADGTYKIARRDGIWRVDERENLAVREPVDERGETEKRGRVDLLELLASEATGEVPEGAAREANVPAALERAGTLLPALERAGTLLPVETIEREGRRLLHYRLDLKDRPERLVLDAFVDEQSKWIESLSLQAERNGRLEPVAELSVLAVNAPVADDKFVVRDTLTEDGRIGKIVDVQGMVGLRPVMHERWTAVCGKLLLKPGDWVRTDNRGANAATVRLVKQTRVILGPGSLVEFVSPSLIRVHSGELEATVDEHDSLEIVGPGEEKLAVRGTQIVRVRSEKLARLEREPLWLKGYRGTTSVETMGSLIARVDGRDVPLTVGYHKVQVDIRDQIARTVIEESFANHTNHEMEGIFYFPLPDDASISGFGMWIGNELVEADVVEKQRAREIYETILRERRDPGLLEWTGGNIFKARVFPIPANAEKRIKISYTQVLPARGNGYRYNYALQSELLKLHPLRELSIDVKVHSAAPLAGISSPTHTVRSDKTPHSAHVEFAAQEYVPTRDFEVLVETQKRQADLVLIPHRRGDDGYFMLQLTPPASGDWQREVVPDGEPVELLILADTSASMDRALRRRQAEFVAALLAALTPRDRVNLAGCDAECDWVFEKPVAAEPKNIAAIRTFLEERKSLGWTDLDTAFASAFKQSGAKTHVVYIGDGIVTTGDARPEGFALRVRQLYHAGGGTCHAVALGSSFESSVLKAIAALGGGSLRHVSGDERPEAAATALLGEITQPGLKDLKIEFRGLDVARVYPEELSNVPAGSQQILLGLYRPTGRDQTGEVVATAMQNGQPVKFSARVSLKDAEEGNSFIPRLWAKMHLDNLLAQGGSQSIRDEIIALSEEFQIMTPYTSFLVLESDADRERFKVQRRFRIRDGEKYFQEGRANANFELVQQQMKRAMNWRLGLRRRALEQLATLGRDGRVFQALAAPQFVNRGLYSQTDKDLYGPVGRAGGGGGPFLGDYDYDNEGDGVMDGTWLKASGNLSSFSANGGLPMSGPAGPLESAPWGSDALGIDDRAGDEADGKLAFEPRGEKFAETRDKEAARENVDWFDDGRDRSELGKGLKPYLRDSLASKRELFDDTAPFELAGGRRGGFGFGGGFGRGYAIDSRLGFFQHHWSRPDYVSWINSLFPALAPLPPAKKPEPPLPTWPAAAVELSASLLRTETLIDLAGGLEIVRETQGYEPRWNELRSRARRTDLYSPARWLTRTEGDNSQTLVHWADQNERGVMGLAFGLGRIRKSAAGDLGPAALGSGDYPALPDHSLAPLHETYRDYEPTLERQDANRTLLILKRPSTPKHETRVLIDAARRVILSIEQRADGKPIGVTKFEDFVEVAGSWWARRIEALDESGRRTSLVTQAVSALPADEFTRRVGAVLAVREQIQFLRFPLPSVLEAKRAQARLGELTFESQFVLLVHFAVSQQWPKVFDELERCEKLAGGKPGMRWVRNAVLSISRRHEELKGRFADAAALLADGKLAIEPPQPGADQPRTGDEMSLAEYLFNQGVSFLWGNERMTLWQTLRPVYERQPPHRRALKTWRERRVNFLAEIGQPDEVRSERARLATDYPHDYNLQQQYAQTLFSDGDYEAAYDWLTKALSAPDALWQDHEANSLRSTYANFLHQQGRYSDLADYLAASIERNPDDFSTAQHYLGALIQADRVPQFEELMAKWLAGWVERSERIGRERSEAHREEDTPEGRAATARVTAAIYVALGQGYYFYVDWIDEKWQQPLADIVLASVRANRDLGPAQQIMGHWRFQQTDACRNLRRELLKLLLVGIDGAGPAAAPPPQKSEPGRTPRLAPERIQRLIDWIAPNDPVVPAETWREIARLLQARWTAEENADLKFTLGQTLSQVLGSRIGQSELLAFLRLQLAQGPEKFRAAFARQLFDTLLAQPWAAALEDEAFSLLEKLSDAKEPIERLLAEVSALYRLTDAMVNARNQAGLARIEHIEQLPTAERRKKTDEQLDLARQGSADRLTQELARHEGPLVPWLAIERSYLDVLTGRNLDEIARASLEALPTLAVSPRQEDDLPDREADVARALTLVLRSRHLATLGYLATRKGADAGLIDRFLQFVDGRLAAEPDNSSWKRLKYELLAALDRPRELQTALTAWVNADGADSRWRVALAYLEAERGAVPEAIALLEAVEIADELGPEAYRVLAGWYLAANRREAYERAMVRTYLALDEWRMSQALQRMIGPWQVTSGHLPSELDEHVLLLFAALFEKSQSPQNYLWQLQQFYQATHDFRLLAVLADSIVGHTAARAYPFISGMRSVLDQVRDEATADQLTERVGKVRERAKTPVDRRALDLLELQVERRAAEVKNQPGPHAALALQALQRAAEHEWGAGEERLVADFLAGLGGMQDKQLAAEQVRQVRALYDRQARGSYDRLYIGQRVAETLWSYTRMPEAVDLLRGALDEFSQAHGGVLPVSANNPLALLVSYLDTQRHFVEAEKLIAGQLRHPVHGQQRLWLEQKLYEIYHEALRYDGQVSVGGGQSLYKALEQRLIAGLDTADQNHRSNLVSQLCGVYRTAHDKKLAGVSDDLVAFANKIVPEVLKRQTSNYVGLVNQVAVTLHDVSGVRAGLAFLIARVEQQPGWFRFTNQDAWPQFGSTLNSWRIELKNLGDLDARLLKIVLAELRRDLSTQQQRNRDGYSWIHDQRFWREKSDDFARVAEEVYAQRKTSGAAVQYIADYLFGGLGRAGRAIEILFIANRDGLLDEGGVSKLVTFLHGEQRFGESISLLEKLIAEHPANMNYRVWLMHSYFRTGRKAELLTQLKETDEYFHQDNRWGEPALAALAASCLSNELYEQSVAYYGELIPKHEQSQPNRGIGNGTLSGYYGGLAAAYSGHRRTSDAVDAACGAIVSWGRNQANRTQAIEALRNVLRQSPDLAAYAAELDRKTEAAAEDRPIVRKALGQVLIEKGQFPAAIAQLQKAVALDPNDVESHRSLIAGYDKANDREGAIREVLALLDVNRREIALYKELAERYAALERPAEAERADTSIVEVEPSESESHALLAEIREKQNCWPEAIVQWEQVARIRELEPTGLLRLADAQIHERQLDAARTTLRKLDSTPWPPRFGDVHQQVRERERKLESLRGK